MPEMTKREEAEGITQKIYELYGSDFGYLFGIPPHLRASVVLVVEAVLKVREVMKKEKG